MGWQGWATGLLILVMLGAFARNKIGPDLIMLGVVLALLLLGIVTPTEAVKGFSSQGVLTVAFLYVVATGLKETGAMQILTAGIIGRPKTPLQAQARFIVPVTFLSAFVNNTPIVAMFMPVISSISRRFGVAPSQLFMPLSFAAILGGVCTLIGTSTNVVLGDLINKHDWAKSGLPETRMEMFTISAVGIPIAVAGVLYMLLFARRLLPSAAGATLDLERSKQYVGAVKVAPGSPVIGKSLEQAGLRHLPGLFLSSIERDGEVIHAVDPEFRLQAGDVLMFVGILESVVDLQKIRGLVPVSDEVRPDAVRSRMQFTEVVVSPQSPLVGQSIREGGFRTRYGAVVIAVQRQGHVLPGKIGDIVLRPGDTLLLETTQKFIRTHRDTNDFYVVSPIEGASPPRHDRAWLSLGVLALVIALMSFGESFLAWFLPASISSNMTEMVAALLGAALMVAMRCCTGPQARSGINWQVLIVIACSFAVGTAMEKTGLAGAIAYSVLGWAQSIGPVFLLAVVYLIAMFFTMLLSNNAAAIMMFPIIVEACAMHGLNPLPFLIAVCVAASCEFSTPLGYQTHLMVMGPGGYKWLDFTRFGLPLNVLCAAICIAGAPIAYGPITVERPAPAAEASPPPPAQAGTPSG